MLRLSRRAGEGIIVGDNQTIEFRLLQVADGVVEVGIIAPKELRILRDELVRRPGKTQAGEGSK